MNKYATWFGRAMWLGILADWILGIPSIFAPNATLARAGQALSNDPIWTSFAALLLFLLSLMYIPGAMDPYRYKASAWLSVIARPPGVIFFLLLYPGRYPAFAYMDGALFLIQCPLLILALRQPHPEWRPAIA